MKSIKYIITALVLLIFFSGTAFAQDLYVFPSQGQSPEQQKRDEFECYTWAKEQTGFDPLQASPPQASAPPPQTGKKGPGTLESAIIGGALGAGIGALTSPSSKRGSRAGKGALIGAGAGALYGQVQKGKQDEQARQADQWTQQQVEAYNQRRDAFNRAYGACLEGKGYTVK